MLLGHQNRRACGLPAFKRPVCGLCLRQCKSLIDFDIHRALRDDVKELVRAGNQILARSRVSHQSRACKKQRASRGQIPRIDRRNWSEALPKLTNIPSGARQSSDASYVSAPTES